MSKADVFNDYWHCFHTGLHWFFTVWYLGLHSSVFCRHSFEIHDSIYCFPPPPVHLICDIVLLKLSFWYLQSQAAWKNLSPLTVLKKLSWYWCALFVTSLFVRRSTRYILLAAFLNTDGIDRSVLGRRFFIHRILNDIAGSSGQCRFSRSRLVAIWYPGSSSWQRLEAAIALDIRPKHHQIQVEAAKLCCHQSNLMKFIRHRTVPSMRDGQKPPTLQCPFGGQYPKQPHSRHGLSAWTIQRCDPAKIPKTPLRQKWIPHQTETIRGSEAMMVGGPKATNWKPLHYWSGEFCKIFVEIPKICKTQNCPSAPWPHGKCAKFMKTMEILPIFTGSWPPWASIPTHQPGVYVG